MKFFARDWIYVAGPYTKGDPILHTRNAILAGSKLYDAGWFPYVPHLSMLWHTVDPRPLQFWYDFDYQPLKKCDAFVRLPGESTGADLELEKAREWGLVIYDTVDEAAKAVSPTA